MFRITEDPPSGSLVECLAKNYINASIVSVDMDKVGVMAAYSDLWCVYLVHCAFLYSELHTRTRGQNTLPTPTLSITTDMIEPFL
jgi:hypothetical protein